VDPEGRREAYAANGANSCAWTRQDHMRRDAEVKCLFLNIALVKWEALAGKSTTEGLRIACSVDDLYYLARATLVKDERNLDKFDRVFGHHLKIACSRGP
jgi:hypothetical protein